MKGEIEIFKNEDDIVEFGIHDTSFRVCIENESYWVDEPDGYNSFTDEIMFKEFYVENVSVRIDTLECKGTLYYSKEDICSELERMLNEDNC